MTRADWIRSEHLKSQLQALRGMITRHRKQMDGIGTEFQRGQLEVMLRMERNYEIQRARLSTG